MKTALDFTEIDAGMLAEVGGKGANLGELTRAGLPVPPGWVLTTEAYRQVAQGLETEGDGLAERARRHLLEAPVPDAVHEVIVKSYAALGHDVPVAVRSSATAEDLPFASFAGQQDTFLNVVGAQAVVEAVRRCWASLWTDRAVAYRESNGIDHAAVRLAVVVQVMVDARVAGVMFTANPVTGRRREAVIDASPGLGEAVVSGAVNPDRFLVFGGEILERQAGDKLMSIRSLPGGGTERVETTHDGLCLTDAEVRKLAALGTRVENHYGAPQDTEWAIDGDDTLWLTQARPITTLYPLPEPVSGDLRVYFSVNVVQGVMGPLTPMGLAAFKVISGGGAGLVGRAPADLLDGASFLRVSGQRLWLDITAAVRSRPGRAILPRLMAVGEARAVSVMERLFEDPRLPLAHTSPRPFLRGAARFARNIRVPARLLTALTRPDKVLADTVRLGEELDRRLRVPGSATPEQRLKHAELVLARTFPLIISIMPYALSGYGLFALASKLSGVPIGEMSDVLRSVPHNPTTEMDLELWHLATRVEPAPFRERTVPELVDLYRSGQLPPIAQREITTFLGKYGHRGVAEIDLGVPRWSEEPAHILGVLANYLRMNEEGLAPSEMFARGEREARAAIDRVAARARGKARWRATVVRFALRRTRKYAGLRELPKFYLVKTLAAVRRSLLAVGEHLVSQGGLAAADDVFFLDLRETRAALNGGDLRELVAGRRAAYEQERRRRHVPRVLLSDGTEPEALSQPAASEGALTGTPASAGTVTGVARVVLDPTGAHLEPGEILVCPSTDPGWTPLFLTAGGLVMEMGGAMSHGAVVAREYGIPAVVGVPNATDRIASGEEITVNGAAGTVTTAP
ncbi:PEP/pyruvate-binding domain-containing protein [Nonomuraea sp. NPDC050404]|uniref:PEP/pyruvate-binding domain-containing protein n=1 Tax=Nonomuraea sp. NPDC050404 TaxID=3155783 RepID=UPI0034022D50